LKLAATVLDSFVQRTRKTGMRSTNRVLGGQPLGEGGLVVRGQRLWPGFWSRHWTATWRGTWSAAIQDRVCAPLFPRRYVASIFFKSRRVIGPAANQLPKPLAQSWTFLGPWIRYLFTSKHAVNSSTSVQSRWETVSLACQWRSFASHFCAHSPTEGWVWRIVI